MYAKATDFRKAERPGDRIDTKGIRNLYQMLIESAPDAMILVERTGVIALVNTRMEELFGYPREELVGQELELLIPERFREGHKKHVARYLEDPRVRPMGTNLKILGLKKNGMEFRADISLSPLIVDNDTKVIAAIRDLTERIRAQEELETNYQIQKITSTILKIALEPVPLNDQLDRILDLLVSIPGTSSETKGLIYLLDDSTGRFHLRARRGFSSDEALPLQDEPAGEWPPKTAEAHCEVFSTGHEDAPCEMICKKENAFAHYCVPICDGGRIIGLINIFTHQWPIADRQKEIFFRAVAHTVAIVIRRNEIEDERHRLLDQMARSEKLAALGRISANIAHEIRNPLTVVGGFARRLQKGVPEREKEQEYAEFIVSEVNRLETILKHVLAFASLSDLNLGKNRLMPIVDEVLQSFEDRLRQNRVVVRSEYGFDSDALMDRDRVTEVLNHLVSNALDAMPSGGTLSIATSLETLQDGAYVTLKIRDTGEGIPPERMDKLFEPFYTTRVSEQGIGLGLSISRKIMTEHGGFIRVESEVGKGSVFTLYFPHRPDENKPMI